MKIKSLLIGMLASVALVGCTDEGFENGTESGKQSELVRGDAYMSFVINTATNSSRGAFDGTTSGDTDADADDNKHHLAASVLENHVEKLLLVIAKVDDTTEELYTSVKIKEKDGVANGYVGYPAVTTANGQATMNDPIRLDYTGKYKVLAIVNPVQDVIDIVTAADGNHLEAYENILTNYSEEAYTMKDGKIISFQMSNKSECVINATASHSVPTNPYLASIPVERTISKTTWRPNTIAPPSGTTVPEKFLKEDGTMKENVYAVKVNVGKATATTGSFWFKDATESTTNGVTKTYDAYYYGYNLNKAKDVTGKYYWVLLKDGFTMDEGGKITVDDIEAIFTDNFVKVTVKDEEGNETEVDYEYTGVLDKETIDGWVDENNDLESLVGKEVKAKLLADEFDVAKGRVKDDFVESLTFDYSMGNPDPKNAVYYYINLTHYAHTNKADKVYTLRHVGSRIMGILNDNEWLVTPTLSYKNKLQDVNDKAALLKSGNINADDQKMFLPLPTGTSEGTANDDLEEGQQPTSHDGVDVGYFMDYIMENAPQSPAIDNITGLVLVGNIYDENGNLVPVLYKYGNNYYRSLRALVNAQATPLKYKDDADKEYTLTENSTDDQAIKAGIDVYKDGRCFYYSSQIKHLDDGVEATKGIMEYAIMRNNVYSLKVSSVTEIGDAQLSLTPSVDISDIRSYVDLEVTMLPWIVRFNDIKL